jgi:TusA-related sulfurtransferase
MINADQVIDVKGMICPRPLLMTRQALKGMEAGQILQVITDDMTTKITFHSFLASSGDELMNIFEDGTVLHHYIKKK